jgi:hypothetical protein
MVMRPSTPMNAYAFGQYTKQTALAACFGDWTIADRVAAVPSVPEHNT